MNEIKVRGNVGRAPELKYTASGKPMAKFSLADTSGQGEYKKTQWLEILIWGSPAEDFVNRIPKGIACEVHGRLELQTFDKRDGTKGFSATVHSDKILLGEEVKWGRSEEDESGPRL